jgi:transcriptional regulator with XRE-family HTH domain
MTTGKRQQRDTSETGPAVLVMKDFRQKVEELLVEQGLQKNELAARLGYTPSRLSQILTGHGEHMPRIDSLARIARALGYELNVILLRRMEMP